jgi:hypothetical protein
MPVLDSLKRDISSPVPLRDESGDAVRHVPEKLGMIIASLSLSLSLSLSVGEGSHNSRLISRSSARFLSARRRRDFLRRTSGPVSGLVSCGFFCP